MSTTSERRAPAPVKATTRKPKQVTRKQIKAAVKKAYAKPAAKKTVKKLSIKEYNKQVEKKNVSFSRMSEAQKRVSIATDVIEQLTAGKINAENGHYIWGVDYSHDQWKNKEMQQLLQEEPITCSACALGSMLYCEVLKRDKFKMPRDGKLGAISRRAITKRLSNYFSALQLDMIETAFEGNVIKDTTRALLSRKRDEDDAKIPTALGKKCIKFGESFGGAMGNDSSWCDNIDFEGHSDIRLKGIMQNIIDNKGTFKP